MPRDLFKEYGIAPEAKSQPRDLFQEYGISPEQKESYAKSLGMAPFRIGADVLGGLESFARNIPYYYEKAKTEVPGIAKLPFTHPLHAAGQIGAGLVEAGRNIANVPSEAINYAAQRLNLLPKSFTGENLQSPLSQQDINEMFGQPQYPGEELARGIARHPLATTSLTNLATSIPSVFKSEKSIAKQIQSTHDALDKKANEGFNYVTNEAYKRGIEKVPLNKDVIDKAEEYFDKSRKTKELFNKAKQGDFNSLRKIQSDLFTKSNKASKSPLLSEVDKGEEMKEFRKDINDMISFHLKTSGNHDLDNVLNAARNDYRVLQNIYYNPKLNSKITDIVEKGTRKVPENLTKVLKEKSEPMKNFVNFHQGLENVLKKRKYRKPILGVGGLLGVGTPGYYGIRNFLGGNEE